MDFQRSSIQPRKKIKVGDDAKHDVLVTACGFNFWKKAPEDLILEIFIRLPDSRSAIRTAAVCHKWHSLISQNPQFIPRFISHHQQHQHRYPLPYAIFFRKAEGHPVFDQFAGPQFYQPVCKLISDQESMFCTSPDFLGFISSSPMVIRGFCNDLLLVSTGSRESTQLYIGNPITKQFIQLPEVPRNKHPEQEYVGGHALVHMPGPTNKSRFKVVELRYTDYSVPGPNILQPVMLFCSESRKWEMRHFHHPPPTTARFYFNNWLHGVACNGILYWLERERFGANRVIYLDLSDDHGRCGAIDFPGDSCRDFRRVRDHIGVVRVRGGDEELRLLQVVLATGMESTVDLKVWKLSDEKEWVLVHHKDKLEKPNRKKYHARPFLHPTDGDVVFMIWGRKVFQYDLKDGNTKTYELMGKLRKNSAMLRAGWVEPRNRLLQFPVMHTYWPTQMCLT